VERRTTVGVTRARAPRHITAPTVGRETPATGTRAGTEARASTRKEVGYDNKADIFVSKFGLAFYRLPRWVSFCASPRIDESLSPFHLIKCFGIVQNKTGELACSQTCC